MFRSKRVWWRVFERISVFKSGCLQWGSYSRRRGWARRSAYAARFSWRRELTRTYQFLRPHDLISHPTWSSILCMIGSIDHPAFHVVLGLFALHRAFIARHSQEPNDVSPTWSKIMLKTHLYHRQLLVESENSKRRNMDMDATRKWQRKELVGYLIPQLRIHHLWHLARWWRNQQHYRLWMPRRTRYI